MYLLSDAADGTIDAPLVLVDWGLTHSIERLMAADGSYYNLY